MAKENETQTEEFTFKDRHGRKWDAMLTLAGAKRVDTYNFEAVAPGKTISLLAPDSNFFEDTLKNPAVLWAMLFAVVKPQVKKNLDIDPDEDPELAEITFCDGLVGPSMDEAREAFWAAIANFFPESKTALLTLLRLTKKAQEKVGKSLRTMESKIQEVYDETVNGEMEKAKRELDKLLKKTKKENAKLGEKSTA